MIFFIFYFLSLFWNLIGYLLRVRLAYLKQIDFWLPQQMTDFDAEISDLHAEMEQFLSLQARQKDTHIEPLTLRTEYKTSLKLTDSNKTVFEVDESFLSTFRDTYTDKAYKAVRLNNWEFEIKFTGKVCSRIDLISESVTFLASRTSKRDIVACHFKVPIVQNEAEVKRLSPQVLGYLNRLGKRHLCEQSYNVNKEMKSLLSFAAVKPAKVQSFSYRPWSSKPSSLDPFAALTPEGKKVLEKLRHFISKQQIRDFILEQEVSAEATAELNARILERQ